MSPQLTGLREAVELEVRRLVADRLGVSPEDLAPEVSLTDELAADSLDLLDLGLAFEAQWAVAIPDRAVAAVRTYGELVDAVAASLAGARGEAQRAGRPALFARARVIPPASAVGGHVLERAGQLTPYAVETLFEDALHAGRGARLEMEVLGDAVDLGRTRVRFAELARRGVEVDVRGAGAMRRSAA